MPSTAAPGIAGSTKARKRSWRISKVALWIVVGVAYAGGATYHTLNWLASDAPGTTLVAAYQIVILVGYVGLYHLLLQRYSNRFSSSIHVFWTPLAAGILYVLVGSLLTRIGRTEVLDELTPQLALLGFDYETGNPLALATVVKMNVFALGEALFTFLLLARLRELVLVKRTRKSQRNWRLMIGFMVLASLVVFMKPPSAGLQPYERLALVPAVGMMVVNSFRLAWILFLSFREKLATIGLSLLLLIVCLGIGYMDEGLVGGVDLIPGNFTYVKFYSYPLSLFTSLAIIFAIVYCTTALLSLLFHLPTTSAFQQKAGEVAAMHSLTHLVAQVLEPDKLYSTIVASPVDANIADAAWLAIVDKSSTNLRPRLVAIKNIDGEMLEKNVDTAALYEEMTTTRDKLVLDQAPADHRVSARPGDGLGSIVGFPLVARTELLGALFVSKEVSHGFEPDDIEAVGVFAAQAVLALDNARLFEERIEKERLERELAIAREVQRKLLPQRVPELAGLSISASSVPAQEVGGDYYDFVRISDDRLGFIIADVSGKGTSAAFYMAVLQGIFRSVSWVADSPVAFLRLANTALGRLLEKSVFISVIYGILDRQQETLSLARAGHCPAVSVRLTGESGYLRLPGMGLGLDQGDAFEKSLHEEIIRLQPGDVFVFYTDGVVESRDALGAEYGYDRLLEVICGNRHEDVAEVHMALLNDLNDFVENGEYGDDMTVLVMKWHGNGAIALPEAKQSADTKSAHRDELRVENQ